jgi:hypothetical protein
MKSAIPPEVAKRIDYLRGAIGTLEIERWWEICHSPQGQRQIREGMKDLSQCLRELEQAVNDAINP